MEKKLEMEVAEEEQQGEQEQEEMGDIDVEEEQEEEEEGEEDKDDSLSATVTTVDSETQEEVPTRVAVSRKSVTFTELPTPAGTAAGTPACLATGMLGGVGFSNGLLQLPPNAVKQPEVTNQIEIFYVKKCPPKGLSVKIHQTTYRLSKGASFTVPEGNLYKLQNLSNKHTIELYFALVDPAAARRA